MLVSDLKVFLAVCKFKRTYYYCTGVVPFIMYGLVAGCKNMFVAGFSSSCLGWYDLLFPDDYDLGTFGEKHTYSFLKG